MSIYDQEIFGPVLSTVRASNYDEALNIVKSNPYGNGVSIFTRDGDTARDFASKANIGMVGINIPIPNNKYENPIGSPTGENIYSIPFISKDLNDFIELIIIINPPFTSNPTNSGMPIIKDKPKLLVKNNLLLEGIINPKSPSWSFNSLLILFFV